MNIVKEVRRAVFAAALRVECPLCGVEAGLPCVTRSFVSLKKPHSRRIDAARDAGLWGIV